MHLILLLSALIASVFAIALPTPDPVPGLGSWSLNRLEDSSLKTIERRFKTAAKHFAKAQAETSQYKKDLVMKKGSNQYEKATKLAKSIDGLHKARQELMDTKIELASMLGEDAKLKALSERKARKAAEWNQRFNALENKHVEIMINSLKDNNHI